MHKLKIIKVSLEVNLLYSFLFLDRLLIPDFFHFHFSPAGWDSLKKISILYENMHSCKAEDYYTDIITAPPSRKVIIYNFFKIPCNFYIIIDFYFVYYRLFRIEKSKCKQKMNKRFWRDNRKLLNKADKYVVNRLYAHRLAKLCPVPLVQLVKIHPVGR